MCCRLLGIREREGLVRDGFESISSFSSQSANYKTILVDSCRIKIIENVRELLDWE